MSSGQSVPKQLWSLTERALGRACRAQTDMFSKCGRRGRVLQSASSAGVKIHQTKPGTPACIVSEYKDDGQKHGRCPTDTDDSHAEGMAIVPMKILLDKSKGQRLHSVGTSVSVKLRCSFLDALGVEHLKKSISIVGIEYLKKNISIGLEHLKKIILI